MKCCSNLLFLLLLALALLLAACAGGGAAEPPGESAVANLQPAALDGGKLQVVATTTLVGDVVRRVGGDQIDLSVLLPPGSDPHSYTATPQDLVALSAADVIFVNGLGLEEALLPALADVQGAPAVSVNEAVTPLEGAHSEDEGEEEHVHEDADPHTWQDVRNVRLWAQTVADALAALDPANADAYAQAGAAYAAELEALHEEIVATLAPIPAERRKLVTDHDTLRYFADAYGFEVVGSVIPSFSSLASISAREMAALQDQIAATGAPALFAGSTLNPGLAEQIAQDAAIPLVSLITDSLGAPGTPEASYVGMMRANAAKIAAALE